MSKMGEFNLELQEQAEELGFETTEEALNAGYEVDMEAMEQGVARLCIDREQEQAHEAWLEEKQQVLNDLDIVAHSDAVPFEHKEIVKQAIEFIKKGVM